MKALTLRRLEIAMTNYRLYFMACTGGHIDRFEAIDAANDAGAVESARLYQGSYPLELWQRGRKVKAFPRLLRPALHPAHETTAHRFRGLTAAFCAA